MTPPAYLKVVYDFERPNWLTYGHVAYVQAYDQIGAAVRAEAGVDAEITRCAITPATVEEYQRFLDKQARYRQWLTNVYTGVPNPRSLL